MQATRSDHPLVYRLGCRLVAQPRSDDRGYVKKKKKKKRTKRRKQKEKTEDREETKEGRGPGYFQ
jgi:hypothetical protein